MSQSTHCEAVMTCLNPRAHHIHLTQSQGWMWRQKHHSAQERSLSKTATMRLTLLKYVKQHRNISLGCRHFGVSRPFYYRWKQAYQQRGLRGLEDRSHRPHRVQPPTWSVEQLLDVKAKREAHPSMGKAKLQILLARDGVSLSVSMIGRMLTRLRRSGQLHEPPRLRRLRGRSHRRPHAIRKPKGYQAAVPGDLVQIDTVDVALTPGTRVQQLTLVDTVARWTAAEVRTGKTARTMRESLKRMEERLPFAIRAVQIDGGSEFKAEFEAYCQEHEIALFVLPPRSPKLNGMVERLQRTYREEFYACVDLDPHIEPVATAVRAYEDTYNTVRPHQALGYLTPQEFLDQRKVAA